jgi:hypothetical protein
MRESENGALPLPHSYTVNTHEGTIIDVTRELVAQEDLQNDVLGNNFQNIIYRLV